METQTSIIGLLRHRLKRLQQTLQTLQTKREKLSIELSCLAHNNDTHRYTKFVNTYIAFNQTSFLCYLRDHTSANVISVIFKPIRSILFFSPICIEKIFCHLSLVSHFFLTKA